MVIHDTRLEYNFYEKYFDTLYVTYSLVLAGLWIDVSFILYIVKFICQILTIMHIFTNQEQFKIKSGYIHLSFQKYSIYEYLFSLSILRKIFQNCFNHLLAPSCFFLWITLASFSCLQIVGIVCKQLIYEY